MPPLPPPEEDVYDSAEDSDFDASLSPSSGDESDDSDANTATATKGKRRRAVKDVDGDVEMGSGDEGIVAQGRKKRRKKGKGKATGGGEDDDEAMEGSVGVRVRLRSGRGGEETKKALPKASAATINVDEIWARMNNPQTSRPSPAHHIETETTVGEEDTDTSTEPKDLPAILQAPSRPEQTITIPHTYIFAGETHTSTKTVPASSPEALAYLSSKSKSSATATGPTLRRPLARKGLLDPNPGSLIKNRTVPPRADLPPSIGGNGAKYLLTNTKTTHEGKENKLKLNTVEKSKLDWEAEVERQGMREELEKAEKSGTSYLGRMEFLGRVEGGEEEERRRARLGEKA